MIRHFKLLVTGCARSGTAYTTQVLRAAGLEIEHEVLGRDGCVSWLMAVEAKTAPWRRAVRRELVFEHILHQVREPLASISSCLATEPELTWDYVTQNLADVKAKNPIARCAEYWYYWNLKAGSVAEWTYRVEDIEQQWPEFQRRLGVSAPFPRQIPKNVNCRKVKLRGRPDASVVDGKPLSWDDIADAVGPEFYKKVRLLAASYGY